MRRKTSENKTVIGKQSTNRVVTESPLYYSRLLGIMARVSAINHTNHFIPRAFYTILRHC